MQREGGRRKEKEGKREGSKGGRGRRDREGGKEIPRVPQD